MKTKIRRKNWIYKGYSHRVSLHEIIKRSYLFCWINLGDEFPPNHITNITNFQSTTFCIPYERNGEQQRMGDSRDGDGGGDVGVEASGAGGECTYMCMLRNVYIWGE